MGCAPAVSPWVARFADLAARGSTVLDVAAGAGRHTQLFLDRGHVVTAVDRDATALRTIAGAVVVEADIESGPWPLAGRSFDLVVVTNYLWRPRYPDILGALAPGGVLLWETFMDGQQHLGRPRNPDFLLQPGELAAVAQEAGLTVLCFEQGLLQDDPAAPAAWRQRVCARGPAAG